MTNIPTIILISLFIFLKPITLGAEEKEIYRFKNTEKDVEQLFDAIKKGARPTDPKAKPPQPRQEQRQQLRESLRDKLRNRFNTEENAVPRSLDDIQSLREMLNQQLKKFFDDSLSDRDSMFDDSFFQGLHPFTDRKLYPKGFKGLGVPGEDGLSEKTTDESIIYEIDLAKVDEKTLDIQISKGQIKIAGQSRIESKEETQYGTSSSTFISSFSKAFALPHGVKEDRVKIEKTDKTVQIIVPKK